MLCMHILERHSNDMVITWLQLWWQNIVFNLDNFKCTMYVVSLLGDSLSVVEIIGKWTEVSQIVMPECNRLYVIENVVI